MNTSFPVRINKFSFIKFILTLAFLCQLFPLFSQEIEINCTQKPLNEILISLRDSYGLMISFDDEKLSQYSLTVGKKFANPTKALDYLLKGLPLDYEINNEVIVIYSVEIKAKPKNYILAGKIIDTKNLETLPFSSILVNNNGIISDAKGNFSYTNTTDSVFKVKIAYLGYYILDTLVKSGTRHIFKLMPSVVALQEIIIEGSVVARSIQTGNSPGTSRINHKIAYFLPGSGDNSVFNLLRLQSGILASGEHSSDLIIWGSYEGHSQVVFDGFTVYGMKNFNDNISAINPYMAKDIKVLKSTYSAEYGERVGGIVDITGIEGNHLSPSIQICINNTTLNGLFSVPFSKKTSLAMAYRQTYYSLYEPIKSSISGIGSGSGNGRSGENAKADYYIDPDYIFRDMNLKFSGNGEKSNYYISLYGGRDNFSYAFDETTARNTISLNYDETNKQYGAAAFYGFRWRDKNTTDLTVSYSSLKTNRDLQNNVNHTAGNQPYSYSVNEQYSSVLSEINSRVENRFVITEKQKLEIGTGNLYYINTLEADAAQYPVSNGEANQQVPYMYLQDNITILNKLTIKPGFRADFHLLSEKMYIQPRFSAIYRFNEFWRINSATGMYNQFVSKNMIIDESANIKYAWLLCDGEEVPVLNSNSYTFGVSYNKNDFTVSIEGYKKNTGNITRYLPTGTEIINYIGNGKTKGLDIFVKKEFKGQTLWVSYTLSKSEELFPYFTFDEYMPAMHDQRHEIKLAGLFKIKSLHFSANYVYGSGFPDPNQLPGSVDYMQFYSRLDASLIYKITKGKLHIDAGVSILNILNTENIKYANYTQIPTDEYTNESFYAEAVPFTPSLFLNILF